ncbi:MAG: putative LPS assembly protein LptD [Bacteroidia bacterium]
MQPKVTKISIALMLFLLQWITSVPALGQRPGAEEQTTDTSVQTIPDTTLIELPREPLPEDAIQSQIRYSAKDSMRFDLTQQKVFLFGNAEIYYENITLKAHYIEIDWNSKILSAQGGEDSLGNVIGTPVFTESDKSFSSQIIRYNFESKRGMISNVRTSEGEGYLHGAIVKKQENNVFYVKDGRYTTCDLDHPHYYLSANRIKVIQNKKIITGPAYLVIEDVPTPLAIPFGMFPNKKGRSSGILMPSYGESPRLGFFLREGGYYFGVSDHFDLALRGDIYTLGSWAVQGATSYAWRYRFNGKLSYRYSNTRFSEPELPDFSINKDFFINWYHAQDPKAKPNTRFTANVNAGSSTFYRNTLSTSQNYLTNTFQSAISYSKIWTWSNLSFNLRHNQNTNTKQVDLTIPEITYSVNRFYPFKKTQTVVRPKWYDNIGVSYQSNFQNQINTYDSLLFRNDIFDSFRYGIRHNVPISTSFKVLRHFTFTPSVNLTSRWYTQTIARRWDPEELIVVTDTVYGFRTANDFNVSGALNTRLYGMYKLPKGGALRHVVTPQISFTYKPDFADPFWGYYNTIQSDTLGNTQTYSVFQNGIFGTPAAGKQELITFNLDNNIEMKVRSANDTISGFKKIKLLESLSFNAGYNFAADSLNLTNISINGRTTIFERINISFGSVVDPYILDTSGIKINKFEINENNRLGRLTSSNLTIGFNFTGGQSKPLVTDKGTEAELEMININPDAYVNFNIPWTLGANYSIYYSKARIESNTTQTINFYGDFLLTPKWKIGFNAHYDFEIKEFPYASVNIYRDLHCWEMKFNWIPVGFQQSYNFQINVKSPVLQDLKLMRRRDWYDRVD